ncbi:TPA: hypothetical protein L6674_000840 [Escherichia coli]|nr:hypothetical protein [Escherichia coli]
MRTQPVVLRGWEGDPFLGLAVDLAPVQGLGSMLQRTVLVVLALRAGSRVGLMLHTQVAMEQMGLSLYGSTHDEFLCGH